MQKSIVRTALIFLSGAGIGAATQFFIVMGQHESKEIPTPAPQQLSCEREVSPLKARIVDLETRLAAAPANPVQDGGQVSSHDSGAETKEEALETGGPSSEAKQEAIRWRVSAIEKFVPLSDEQKTRLADKFQKEQASGDVNEDVQTESLDEILGAENAQYYRDQVKAAFERVQNEEIQKEVLWTSRQLNLSADQERSLSDIFNEVERRIDAEFGDNQHGVARSAQERVKRMVAENKRRAELRSEQAKGVLPPEQYQGFVRLQAESAASDVEVFHDPGASSEQEK